MTESDEELVQLRKSDLQRILQILERAEKLISQ